MVQTVKNLYEILEIDYTASFDEIKAAYKKLVRIYHPDINKSKTAEINFKLLNNAYEVLSDPIKKKNYDDLLKISGVEFKRKNYNVVKTFEKKENKKEDKKENPPDIFDYQNAIIKEIKITPDEAKSGTIRTVNILNKQTCPKCHGRKFINSSICAFCRGEGEKKEYRKIDVKIKKGIKENETVYVGRVNDSVVAVKNLFLKIKIEPYKKLFFEDNNVLVYINLDYEDLILGKKEEISIQEAGVIEVNIPPLTKPETRIKLDIDDNKNINYYAVIELNFPSYISNDDKILYDKIRRTRIGEV